MSNWKRWTDAETDLLLNSSDVPIGILASQLGRSYMSIANRRHYLLNRLKLIEKSKKYKLKRRMCK